MEESTDLSEPLTRCAEEEGAEAEDRRGSSSLHLEAGDGPGDPLSRGGERPRSASSIDDDALYAVLARRRKRGLQITRWVYFCMAGLALLAGLPCMIYSLASTHSNGRAYLLPVSALFAGVSVPIALIGIYAHMSNYWQPVLQVYVARILWMVPVYAVCSFSELLLWLRAEGGHAPWASKWTAVPGAIRDCYESYTVLNFFYFMVTFLEVHYGESAEVVLRKGARGHAPRAREAEDEDDDDDGSSSSEEEEEVKHPCPPYRWFCAPWRLDGPEFLDQCKYGVLLYATVMPICALCYIVGAFVEVTSDDDGRLAAALSSPAAWARVGKG